MSYAPEVRPPSAETLRSTVRKVSVPTYLLQQTTAAATIAWALANWVGDHEDPFFAPIAAVVALSSPLGERGSSAVRLVTGVLVGIVTGEVVIGLLGGGYGRLALAMFVAMAVARSLTNVRLVTVQAGASAILTVAVANGEVGPDRLIDALIGAGVALVFSQVLFSPEPVRLIRRAAAAVLARMGAGLDLAADALRTDDDELAEQAMDTLRELRDDLAELSRTRKAGRSVVRHSAIWRARHAPVVDEHENTGHLDLLGGSCTMLVRTALVAPTEERARIAPFVHELASTLKDLAADPGSRTVRSDAVERALDVARGMAAAAGPSEQFAPAMIALKQATTDLMVFAGVAPKEAAAAVEEGTGQLRVVPPPSTPRLPFTGYRRRPPR